MWKRISLSVVALVKPLGFLREDKADGTQRRLEYNFTEFYLNDKRTNTLTNGFVTIVNINPVVCTRHCEVHGLVSFYAADFISKCQPQLIKQRKKRMIVFLIAHCFFICPGVSNRGRIVWGVQHNDMVQEFSWHYWRYFWTTCNAWSIWLGGLNSL